jgi:hypothetical protein
VENHQKLEKRLILEVVAFHQTLVEDQHQLEQNHHQLKKNHSLVKLIQNRLLAKEHQLNYRILHN